MILTVKLFARAKDLAGADCVDVEVPEKASVADLRGALRETIPALAPLVPSLLVAVGNDYADDTTELNADSKLACFPPVSGG